MFAELTEIILEWRLKGGKGLRYAQVQENKSRQKDSKRKGTEAGIHLVDISKVK